LSDEWHEAHDICPLADRDLSLKICSPSWAEVESAAGGAVTSSPPELEAEHAASRNKSGRGRRRCMRLLIRVDGE
jgi:hypothetical protein